LVVIMTCIVGSISNTYFLWALINIIIFGTVGMRVHEYYSTVFFRIQSTS